MPFSIPDTNFSDEPGNLKRAQFYADYQRGLNGQPQPWTFANAYSLQWQRPRRDRSDPLP